MIEGLSHIDKIPQAETSFKGTTHFAAPRSKSLKPRVHQTKETKP
jgi:hypothetical protein